MTSHEWARLMRQARAHAEAHQHRVRVRSVKLGPEAAARFGISWAYAVDCSARARDLRPGH